MTRFYLDGQPFDAAHDETLLEALVRQGQDVQYSCKKGRCRSCLVQQIDGSVAPVSQRGLTVKQQEAGIIYACQCFVSDQAAFKTLSTAEVCQTAVLVDKHRLSNAVMQFIIKPSEAMSFNAGQCISLRRHDGLSRSYGIASTCDSGAIALHVRLKSRGQFSHWLFDEAKVGETLWLQGPWGDCCYLPQYCDDSLILVASGTGLGPALGLVQEALAQGHTQPIYLYHGALNREDLYLHRALLRLMLEYRNVHYQGCIQAQSERDSIDGNRIVFADPFTLASSRHTFDRKHRVFMFGEPNVVAKAQETAFLNGVPIERVHALAFDYRDLRKHPRS